MPIRFRCAYCNQLMAIASRKAGTIVRCPKCGGQVIVPDAEPASSKKGSAGVFERSDFDDVLKKSPGTSEHHNVETMPSSGAIGDVDVEPVALPGTLGEGGMIISTGRFVLYLFIVLVLIGLSFFGGYLFGRTSKLSRLSHPNIPEKFVRGN